MRHTTGPAKAILDRIDETPDFTEEVPVVAVDLLRIRIPFREPFVTAHGVETDRESTLVKVRRDDGSQGWGECVALARPTYTAEWAEGAFEVLHRLFAEPLVNGSEPLVVGHPFAHAALACARADAHLRAAEESLVSFLGGERRSVEMCAVVGGADSVDELLGRVERVVGEGYGSVSLKIAPGRDREPLAAVRSSFPDLALAADANGSYDPHHPFLLDVDDLGLTHLEQPCRRDDLVGHADLAARLETPVALDESIGSEGDLAAAAALDAIDVLNFKPARVGGLAAATRVLAAARARGIPVYVGGMVEAGVGRAFATAFASLEIASLPTHLGPTDRYLLADVTDPLVVKDGQLAIPEGPGIGVDVDESLIDAFLVDRVTVQA